jgi:hypothetical protein
MATKSGAAEAPLESDAACAEPLILPLLVSFKFAKTFKIFPDEFRIFFSQLGYCNFRIFTISTMMAKLRWISQCRRCFRHFS